MTLLPSRHIDADVAIVGSGFAGSLTALCLRQRGRRVVLLERGRHPRFAIGESSTPLANLLLEELADRYELPQIRVFSKWGTWQRERPDVAGGLKRGFSFFFQRPGEAFHDSPSHERQMLVAASPRDEVADTHWYRADFDHMLVREAQAQGAIVLDEAEIHRFDPVSARASLDVTRHGESLRITAAFVIDASGPRGFLHRALDLETARFEGFPHTHGLYSHFQDVGRWEDVRPCDGLPPFPPDEAALHHVFPGGWIWVLRFNNGITSAGAALTDAASVSIHAGADGATAWSHLLETMPSVRDQFANARPVLPFVYFPHLSFRTSRVSGANWAMLPSAAGVVDPLLSTGFALTLLGISRLLDVLERTAAGAERERALDAYARVTLEDLDVTAALVSALYTNFTDPDLFKRLSLLYFAAASFSEAARRLGRLELAPGFLLQAHPRFGRELRACAAIASRPLGADEKAALMRRVTDVVKPFDTAGLTDWTRRDWYPVLADDLFTYAGKLSATPAEVRSLLERCGFAPSGFQPAAPPVRR
jgi:FADH2 O2-dependent halogenase